MPRRFDRYDLTNGYNLAINARQFRGLSGRGYGIGGESGRFLPSTSAKPNVTYSDRLALSVGGIEFDLHHAKGETDDHTWAWIPAHKAICAGDFFIWNFPNAGNPQKVQRYPVEWAAAMRAMAGAGAELFLPAHGLPIAGAARIKRVLLDVAETLEKLINETLAMMNAGAPLNDIIHTVKVAPEMLQRPYLRPLYDEPEFVVRNLWRMYGGWYDGNPANLKPAPERALAAELADTRGRRRETRRARASARRRRRTAARVSPDRDRRARRTAAAHLRRARRDLSATARQRDVADGEGHLRPYGRRVARRAPVFRIRTRKRERMTLVIRDRSRPATPGYFRPENEGAGLLDWEETARRFSAPRNYWVATASLMWRPHTMPVWGVWLDDRFWFSTGTDSRKARNLRENTQVAVHLEDGDAVIVIEGRASEISDTTQLLAFLDAYNPKYAWDFTLDQVSRGVFAVSPEQPSRGSAARSKHSAARPRAGASIRHLECGAHDADHPVRRQRGDHDGLPR